MKNSTDMTTNEDAPQEKPEKKATTELEKSFGLGTSKKSFIVSRGYSINEIVKAGN